VEEHDWVRYSYSVKNIKTEFEMFGEISINADLHQDVSFDDLRPLILERAKKEREEFTNSEDVEITVLDSSLEAARGD
jgi:hypothetical protein